MFLAGNFGLSCRSGTVGGDDCDFRGISRAESNVVGLRGAVSQGEWFSDWGGVDKRILSFLLQLFFNAREDFATATREKHGLGSGQAKDGKGGEFSFGHVELRMLLVMVHSLSIQSEWIAMPNIAKHRKRKSVPRSFSTCYAESTSPSHKLSIGMLVWFA